MRFKDGSLCREDAYERRYSTLGNGLRERDEGDVRTETERDRGRLSYSPYLRRLAGVTQVTSPDLTATRMHSRASHTYKVATIAREIAEYVVRRADEEPRVAEIIRRAGGLDVTACEAAGLAHDLGHPPFGHAGEEQLNRLLRLDGLLDGFEGNAQSFRIVTRLELRATGVRGLSLTNVTLAAIQKYPFTRQPGKSKFGAYATEVGELESCRRGVLDADWDNGRQTLEASVMDLADDIAYAVHDLEDFCGAGAIDLRFPIAALGAMELLPPDADVTAVKGNPFSAMGKKLAADYRGLFDPEVYRTELGNVFELLTDQFPDITSSDGIDYQANLRRELASLVGYFFARIDIREEPRFEGGPQISLDVDAWHRLQALKVITREYLVSSPRVGLIQKGQTAAMASLYAEAKSWLESAPDPKTIPPELHDFLGVADQKVPERPKPERRTAPETLAEVEALYAAMVLGDEHLRAICDYICGMSDSEALLRSQWFAGTEIPGMSALGVMPN
ncbi:dNTP triphosphohydrolase [Agromyces mediolanus]|uniref:dGTP triphosphohydrolase n=1 Tax=Agromyces mediolanus TaxID=41986 RepID=UPI003834654C